MMLTTFSSESVRLSHPVFARGWLTMRRSTPNRRNSRPHPARIGECLDGRVGIECRIELVNRLIRPIGEDELAASVFRRRGVEQRPRRRRKLVRGGHQCPGIAFEYPADISDNRCEQRDRRLVMLQLRCGALGRALIPTVSAARAASAMTDTAFSEICSRALGAPLLPGRRPPWAV